MDKFTPKNTTHTLSKSMMRTSIDNNGNIKEQIEERIFKAKKASEPAYVKTYLCDLDIIFALPKGVIRVLYRLFDNVQFNKNTIDLNAAIKRQIARELGIKFESIDNALVKLCKANFLLRIDTGSYLLNPYYFAKGDWKNVVEIRKKVEAVYDESNQLSFVLLTKSVH